MSYHHGHQDHRKGKPGHHGHHVKKHSTGHAILHAKTTGVVLPFVAKSGQIQTATHAVPKMPASLAKKNATAKKIAAELDAAALAAKKAKVVSRRTAFKNAEKYRKEYAAAELDIIRKKRVARKVGNFYVAPEPKVMVLIRIKGINAVAPKVKKVLQLFRLRQINNAVFVKVNKATMNMVRLIEPYIAYGYPNLKTVSNLLWPFKLNNPNGGWKKKTNHFQEGGD